MADALDSGVVLHRDGLMLVGEFVGKRSRPGQDGRTFEEIVIRRRRFDGDTWETGVLYDPADRDTGEATPIVGDLGGLDPGDYVALTVKARASKNGGVWFAALRADRLPVADLVG